MATELSKLNTFIMFKVPAAWICGVRIRGLEAHSCRVSVKHRWINQNPFNSLYFAVQAMAAELSTGALVMKEVRESGKRISMLVKSNNSTFSKKATGRIEFTCQDGLLVKEAIAKAVETGEGQTVWLSSRGVNEAGVKVSGFNFEWTLKVKEHQLSV